MMGMNVTTYAFNIVAANLLGPAQYGAVAAILGVLLVVTVIQLGLQATAARRLAAGHGSARELERQIQRTTWHAAVAIGALCLVLSPVINQVLRLHSLPTAALVAVCAVPLTLMGGQAGLLQGEERWRPLALIYLSVGVGRLVLGVACILLWPTETSAAIGIALGTCVPAVVGHLALRHHTRGTSSGDPVRVTDREIVAEVVSSTNALLAFMVLSNVDIVLARSTLTHLDAGLYAGGLIMTKAVLFLPQFVAVVAFPAMARDPRGRTPWRPLALTAGLGGLTVLGTWALSPVMVLFVGGHRYRAIQGDLWRWALLGTVLAMIYLLVYGQLARQHRGAVWCVWLGVAALIGLARLASSPGDLLLTVTLVDAGVLLVLAASGAGIPARASSRSPRPTTSEGAAADQLAESLGRN